MATDHVEPQDPEAPSSAQASASAAPVGTAAGGTLSPIDSLAPPRSEFDIVQAYRTFLSTDPEITKPLAAIEALIKMLRYYDDTSTVMETLSKVSDAIEKLQASVDNPIPLKAGTDLFKEYLLQNLKGNDPSRTARRGRGNYVPERQSFAEIRDHLLKNANLFSSRAKDARRRVAEIGARFVLDGQTIMTHGGSRTVGHLLTRAAELHQAGGGSMFKVVYIQPPTPPEPESEKTVAALRKMGVAVATIHERTIPLALSTMRINMVVVGAETVCQNGAIISRLGTRLVAHLAHQFGIPFLVAAETHKMVKYFPLSQKDTPEIKQDVVVFRADNDGQPESAAEEQSDAVEYTPPNLITNIITEVGVKLPSAVIDLLADIQG